MEGDRFGDHLRGVRNSRRLTQEDLAEASGTSVRSIREMERNRVRAPHRRTATLLADALGLSGDERDVFLDLAQAGRAAPPAEVPTEEPVPAELPAAVPDLAGRSGELAALRAIAAGVADGRTGTASVVVLYGPPGIGKTSLAVAAGHLLSDGFPGGRLFVDLHGASPETPVDPAEALAGFLRAVGVPDDRVPATAAGRGGLFRTLTRDRRLLVLLDNAADEAQVRPLLPAGRRCLVLVTSRRPLTGLAGAGRVPLDLLDAADARRLLVAVIGADRVAAETAAADQLIRLCGRLPLAVRIAGNRLSSRPQWTIKWFVDQLHDQRRRLTVLAGGDQCVRAAFQLSYRQLDQATAAAFRRAALIPGADFDAALMAAAADTDEARAAQTAEELADAGLLLSRGDRYQFHDLVRLYARERLDCDDSPDLRGAARDRVTGWLLHRTEQAGAMFEPDAVPAGPVFADHEAAAAWLDRESGNWPAALRDAARQGRHDEVIRVARALHWYSDATSHRHAWEEIFSLGVTAAQAAGRPRDEAALLNFLGWARFYTRDRNEDGLAALRRALTLAQQIGDRREEAWALTYTASIYVRTDRAAQAVEPARQAAELFAGMGYRLGESAAVNMWGVALAKLGRFVDAVRAHRSVLDFYRTETGLSSTGALIAQASTLMHMGAALGGWGRWRAAANAYDRAGRLFQSCGAAFGEATAAYRHGLALRSLARDDDASAQLRQARLLFAGIPSPWWEAQTLYALAGLADRAAVAGVTGRRLREQALDRCVDLDAPEAVALRETLLRELAG